VILIAGITNKLIFTSLLFIYFIHPSKSADLGINNRSEKNIDNKLRLFKKNNFKYATNFLLKSKSEKNFVEQKQLSQSDSLFDS